MDREHITRRLRRITSSQRGRELLEFVLIAGMIGLAVIAIIGAAVNP